MNENRNKHFKLRLNRKNNKFSVQMDTIHCQDTLILKITKPEDGELTPIGEIQINILDLYLNKKKKYLIGENVSIDLKIKYVLSDD